MPFPVFGVYREGCCSSLGLVAVAAVFIAGSKGLGVPSTTIALYVFVLRCLPPSYVRFALLISLLLSLYRRLRCFFSFVRGAPLWGPFWGLLGFLLNWALATAALPRRLRGPRGPFPLAAFLGVPTTGPPCRPPLLLWGPPPAVCGMECNKSASSRDVQGLRPLLSCMQQTLNPKP